MNDMDGKWYLNYCDYNSTFICKVKLGKNKKINTFAYHMT